MMAIQVNTHEAKTQLSKLLVRVQAGEEVVIAKAGIPVARLVAVNETVRKRIPGTARGNVNIHADFNDPLSEDVLASFEQ
jgi:prevent-host-death family protein